MNKFEESFVREVFKMRQLQEELEATPHAHRTYDKKHTLKSIQGNVDKMIKTIIEKLENKEYET